MELEAKIREINREHLEKIEAIITYYRNEFGDNLKGGKLTLKAISCNNKRCKSCPHGPYWYRAVYDKKKKRWIFRYLGSSLKSKDLKYKEREFIDRYQFYEGEIKRLKKERRDKLRAIRAGR